MTLSEEAGAARHLYRIPKNATVNDIVRIIEHRDDVYIDALVEMAKLVEGVGVVDLRLVALEETVTELQQTVKMLVEEAAR